MDWFVRFWHPFGWQENAVIIFIHFLVWFIHFWVRFRAFRLALKWHDGIGPDRMGLGVKKKTYLLNKMGSGNGGGPEGRVWA